MNMIIQRTIKLRLRPTPEQASILTQAIQAYTDSFNHVSAYGWTHKVFNSIELHKATYLTQRMQRALPSQLAISARMKATEALVSVKALLRKGKKANQPQSLRCPIRYDQRSYGLWFDRNEVSLLTLQGRLRIPFTVAKHYQQYATWQRCSADVIQDRKGRWWLHVVMSKDIQETPLNDTDESFVGVDLGIVNPAADSRGQFYGSEHWEKVERRHAVLRAELQSKGTRSAKRKLKRTSGRQRRFRLDCDHVLSKRLVQSMESGQTLVFEKLTDIRGRVKLKKAQRKRLHKWSFAQLQTFVEYKARAMGVSVVFVDPRYTSQKCSKCKHVSRSNRPEQSVFKCRVCKFTCHADHNAAINIRANYLQFKGLSVNQSIVATQGDISFG